jgi:hypothetical protein
MRILNDNEDKRISEATIYLTENEAKQLLDFLKALIEDRDMHHFHIDSEDFKDRLTITIYDDKDLKGFDERSKKLILEGK